MSARGEQHRRELGAAADELFDAIYTEDLAALVAKFNSRSKLRDAAVDRAEKVTGKLAGGAEQVTADEYLRLIAATLTWGKSHAGVHQNTGHAAKKFRRNRRFPELPPEILVRIGRIDPDDDDRVIALLARSLRIRKGVTDARSAGEPKLILNAVVPAIVAALAEGPDQPPDLAADVALVGTALDVLERGAELAAAYQASERPTTGVDNALPVIGNADFLVRIAAYHLAIEERRGLVATQLLDELQKAVAELVSILRKAMTRSTGRWGWRTPDEPDVAGAIDQFAEYLGSAARDATTAGRRVRKVNAVLSHRLHLDEPPDELPVEDPDWITTPLPDVADHAERLSDVEHLAGWLVAALFRGAGSDAREPLLDWLSGKPLTNRAENLPLLVRRLRVAITVLDTTVLDQMPTPRPPRPAGVTPSQFEALTARLAAAVDPGDIGGCTQADARRLTLAALPPLWTRRWPAIQLVARHLRIEQQGHRGPQRIEPGHSGPRKAVLVAAHGVRAPVQFVQPSTRRLPVPCCPDAGTTGRPAPNGRPREPVHYEEICPHRPWGEIGWVENYRSLGDAAGFTEEAARRQLERYRGPWPELLWP